jgi:thiol:disulfide interchange protein DsbD
VIERGILLAALLLSEHALPASIRWRTDEAAARAEALRSGRALLIDARADWCAGCKLLDRNTWSDPAVRNEVQERFVPLRLDLSQADGPDEARLRALGVEALPAVLVCAPRGCDRDSPRSVGYVGPGEMLVFLRGPPPSPR